MQMSSEGMRRLGIVLGVLASIAWIIYIADQLNGFANVQLLGWLVFFAGIPVSFGIMFLVIWAVDWVIIGFRNRVKR